MTKTEREVWHQSIRGLRMQYQFNLNAIEELEDENEVIMKELFTKIDQFEKESEDPNKGMFDKTDLPG